MYGSGYTDDIHPSKYKIRDKLTHTSFTIKELERIKTMFEISIDQIQFQASNGSQHSNYQSINSTVLKQQLTILMEFQ